ncbi:hypothetical protein FE257_002890 [Aspergillus nanangensis]|uniref:Major facilitator superfamily (MFS) profile domain-containing protein n=1 Tax=Aspergillus nanangensis TaxID=2582783 RepID=A0AAD4GWI4_ASPNN|nr:hypothetical protein FE257_002890 [Aspergillus nanangensis]
MANNLPENQQPSSSKPSRANAYAIGMSIIITISSFAYGYAGAIIATTLTQPSFHKSMGLDSAPNAHSLIGAINGLYYGGGVVGAFIAGWMSNRWGRKISTTVGNILVLVAGAIMTGSVNSAMFIVFRFVSGVGSFMILATVPVWVAELAPPQIRGIIVDIHAVSMLAGYTVASYVGLGFYFVTSGDVWRGPMGLQVAWPLIVLCGMYWVPESPRFLVSRGRNDEAWTIIKRMHASKQDPTDEHGRREFHQIQKQIELDALLKRSYWEILKKPSLRRRVWMTILLEFAFMSSGILVVLNNGSIIWRDLGFDTVQILNFQAGFQLCGLVCQLIGMLFVDRVKRTWLIAGGLIGCAVAMTIEMVLQRFYLNTAVPHKAGLAAAATMIFLLQVTFAMLLDGATYFYVAEIWPTHLRSQGFAIGMATLCATNLTWLLAAPTALATIGWKFYLFFVCIPAASGVVVLWFYPDTLQKPLEEIAAMFGDEDVVGVSESEMS